MAEERTKKTQLENINEKAIKITSDLPASDDNLDILQAIINNSSQNAGQNNQDSDL